MEKKIIYIGLGKMGSNMVERLMECGFETSTFDKNNLEAMSHLGAMGAGINSSVKEAVEAFPRPRLVWIMVPHTVVDDVLGELIPLLDEGDVVVDGGNSHYKDSLRRGVLLKDKHIAFLDVGVSGGPEGARNGASLMVGGDEKVFKEYEALFQALAVPSGYGYVGDHGAGHFVKMVHNGIEYGMMQAIGEGFEILKSSEFHLSMKTVTGIYEHGSVIESQLISWLQRAYGKYGEDLDGVSAIVKKSGEGDWTVEAAKDLGISAPIITEAVRFREESEKNERYAGKVISALRGEFGGHNVQEK